jgi:hypothetical protein
MSNCPRIEKCPFFNDKMMLDKPGLAAMYKQHYCMDKYTECARYMVSEKLGPGAVPADLCPNQLDLVEQILE